MAAFAVLAAVMRSGLPPVALRATDAWTQWAAAIGTITMAVGLGAIIGLHHHRWLRGLGWGALTGLIIGLLAAPLAIVPAASLTHLTHAALGGAVILLLVAAIVRFTTRSTPVSLEPDGAPSTHD
jgi:hypothetical protein